MKKLVCMAVVALVTMALMTPAATAGVGGANPDRPGGSAGRFSLQDDRLTVGAVAARSIQIPGVGGAEPDGVGGARPDGVGGARPWAGGVASRLSQLPPWLIESLLRVALGQ